MKSIFLKKTLIASACVMILTIIHHIYGAIIYETPVRLHITWFAIPVLIVMALFYTLHVWDKSSPLISKTSLWAFNLTVLLIPVVTFGVVEGGYNHLLKNILYFGGTSAELMDQFYSDPIFEMPNDFWFEATGILQLFIGLAAGYYLIKCWMAKD
ncbi:MAG: hypothetical protein JJU37_04025 [Balneolaceae bacterium]|nr:hypothetical protein [Balneolaceae bacterium]